VIISKISFVSRTPPFFNSNSYSSWGLITSQPPLDIGTSVKDCKRERNRNECNEENNGKQINGRPKERTIELGPFRRLVKTRTALRVSPKHQHIFEGSRSKRDVAALNKPACPLGIENIQLHVWGHGQAPALRLPRYESLPSSWMQKQKWIYEYRYIHQKHSLKSRP
jgi:hypothetical protein